jgi:hypothetical protein
MRARAPAPVRGSREGTEGWLRLATLLGIDLAEDEHGWLVSGRDSGERQSEAVMGNAVQPWLGRAEPLGFSNPVSLGWVVVRHRCLDSAMVWNRAYVKEARRRKWLQRGLLAHRVSAVITNTVFHSTRL